MAVQEISTVSEQQGKNDFLYSTVCFLTKLQPVVVDINQLVSFGYHIFNFMNKKQTSTITTESYQCLPLPICRTFTYTNKTKQTTKSYLFFQKYSESKEVYKYKKLAKSKSFIQVHKTLWNTA